MLVVQVEQTPPNVLNIQEVNPEDYRTPEVLKTIEQALSSKTLMLRVIHALKLENDPDFAPKEDGPWTEIGLSEKLGKQIRVAQRRGSRLIEIEAGDHNPERAKLLAETVLKEFTQDALEQRVRVWKETNVVLLREAEELKKNLQASEQALQDFKEQHQSVSLEDSQNIVVEKLRDLNFKLTTAKSERLRLEGDLAALEACKGNNLQDLMAIPSVAALPAIQVINKQISDQEAQRASLKEQYLSRNTRLISTETQLGELVRTREATLANAGQLLRQAYASARDTEAKLETALRAQEQSALELNRLEIPVKALRREIESNRALYDALIKRLKETDITQGFDPSYLRVVESPLLAEKPAWPRKGIVLVLALFGGLLAGTGTVIASDLLSTAAKSAAQVEDTLGLRVLATVAKARRREGELLAKADADSEAAEAFRWLRTSMQLGGAGKAPRTIVFTGARTGDGATFCATNYALTLTQQGRRVLLIDANLRQPRLAKLFQAKLNGSATAVLAGELKLEQASTATGHGGLSLLAAPEPARNAATLLASDRWPAILEEALAHFDHVVIDTTPLDVFSDTVALAPQAEAVCLVIRAGETPLAMAKRVCTVLSHAQVKLAGVILNGQSGAHRHSSEA